MSQEYEDQITVTFIVPGVAYPKQRPRVFVGKYDGKPHLFTPKETVEFENRVKQAIRQQCPGVFLKGFLTAEIDVYCPFPARATARQLEAMKSNILQPTVSGDIDNICKSLVDAGNKLLYPDDRYFHKMSISKHWTDREDGEGYTVVRITSHNEKDLMSYIGDYHATPEDFSKPRIVNGTGAAAK